MDFDENADLDTSSVEDVRSSGGGGIPGGGLTIGGGAVGLIVAVVLAVLGVNTMGSDGGADTGTPGGDNRALAEKCNKSNAERFQDADCRQVATFNDLQQYWGKNLQPTLNAQYRSPRFVLFRQSVNTACGGATADVGPFYCPGDEKIYIDLAFYDELASRFGAPGQFAQAYVIAHEFGHHIQKLTGTEAQVRRLQQRDPGRANQYSVALELQADCFAGAWSKNASAAGGLVDTVSEAEMKEALTAAASVGDDRIQEKAGGRVNPETWTHGSAAQRQQWFTTGLNSGNPASCNTFAGG